MHHWSVHFSGCFINASGLAHNVLAGRVIFPQYSMVASVYFTDLHNIFLKYVNLVDLNLG